MLQVWHCPVMKRFIVAGVLVFLTVLVASLPAKTAYDWLAPPGISVSGVSGTIWRGTASEGLVSGGYFRNLRWSIMPTKLFIGKLAYDVSADPVGGRMSADVAVALTGAVTVTDLTGSIPLDLVHPAMQQEGINGDVAVSFPSLVLRDGRASDIDGSVTIGRLIVPILSPTPLGSFRADFQSLDGNVSANITDTGGVLSVAAVLTVTPNQAYSLVGDVSARDNAPRSVTDQLRFLGSPDSNGQRAFRFEGTL